MEKTYLTADQLLKDSFRLATDIIDSKYQPTLLIGVWRGGAPIAIAIHEVLRLCGIECDHMAVKCASYSGIEQRQKEVDITGLHYLQRTLTQHDRVLIVDDILDTGYSLAALIDAIKAIQQPASIKVACAYYNPDHNEVGIDPDYFVHQSERWLVFPHELQGLSNNELASEKPGMGQLRQWLKDRADR